MSLTKIPNSMLESGGGGGGSALQILDESTSLTLGATSISFAGSGVTASAVGTDVTVSIAGSLPTASPISALNIDWSLADMYYKDLSVSMLHTFTFSNIVENKTISVFIHNTGVSAVSVAFPSGIYKESISLAIEAGAAGVYSFTRVNSRTYLLAAANLTNV